MKCERTSPGQEEKGEASVLPGGAGTGGSVPANSLAFREPADVDAMESAPFSEGSTIQMTDPPERLRAESGLYRAGETSS